MRPLSWCPGLCFTRVFFNQQVTNVVIFQRSSMLAVHFCPCPCHSASILSCNTTPSFPLLPSPSTSEVFMSHQAEVFSWHWSGHMAKAKLLKQSEKTSSVLTLETKINLAMTCFPSDVTTKYCWGSRRRQPLIPNPTVWTSLSASVHLSIANEWVSSFPTDWDILFLAPCQETLAIHYQREEMERRWRRGGMMAKPEL